MIEFNLLPDIKRQFVEFQRYSRRITIYIVIGVAASTALVLLMFSLVLTQKRSSANIDKQITTYRSQISNVTDVDKILTIQNQLKTITTLHAQKPASSRLFDYLPQLTPLNVSISELVVNYDLDNMKVVGTADSLETVNKFVDTLKFTTYTSDGGKTTNSAFTSVVLQSFGRDSKNATFTVGIVTDKNLFDSSQTVKLTVPQNYTSTRSFTELPNTDLFNSTGTK